MIEMEKIVWDDSFNLQVDEIDRQHRRLVELMNRLLELQEEKNPTMPWPTSSGP